METKLPTQRESKLKIDVAMGELLRLREIGEDTLGQETWYDVIAAIACLDRVWRDINEILWDEDEHVFAPSDGPC